MSGQPAGPHKIQGIGPNFLPKNYSPELIDGIISVTNEDATETAINLSKQEGILSGFSGGGNVWAAVELSKRPENSGKLIITILPDCGERYLSSALYQ